MSNLVRNRSWVGACLIVGLVASSARADVPRLIQFQGKLLLDSGAAVPGPITLRVRLYDQPSDPSSLLFDETFSGLMLSNGLFSVLLGSQTMGGIPDSALVASEVYLGASVDGNPEMLPRRRIVTTPYTVKAKAAEQLVEPDTLNPAVTVATGGRVGIGTASPDASATVDVTSTTGGFLPPRMTTAERDAIASPAAGLMVFNTSSGCLNLWSGSAWTVFGAPSAPGNISGPSNICVAATGVVFSVSDVPGAASYTWTVPPGSNIVGGQGTAFVTVNFGTISGTMAVTAANDCGASAASILSVAVIPSAPDAPVVLSGPQFVGIAPCVDASAIAYTISAAPSAVTYTWAVPTGATITSGQGTTQVTINFNVGTPSGDVTVTADNACGSSSPPTYVATAVPAGGGGSPQLFSATGATQAFVVPCTVNSTTIEAWGAQGQRSNGGLGGYARASLPVTPGEVLVVNVGTRAGFNGGGAPSDQGGGGGGGSDVRQGGSSIADRKIVAGGGGGGDVEEGNVSGAGGGGNCGSSGGHNYCGGGAGQGWNGYHGNVGGLNGGAEISCSPHGGAGSGGGFLSGGGGACGNNEVSCRAETGALGQGGAACDSCPSCGGGCGGGGGGGGYYGGGGGASGNCGDGSGGGGSSWTGTLASPSFSGGVRSGDGQVVISW